MYTKNNRLRRIESLKFRVKQELKPGMTLEYVYKTFIYPEFKISKRCFHNWLKTDTSKISADEKNKSKIIQLSMEFVK